MPGLVAHVPEQGAVGLAERDALPLALGGIRLRNVDRDETVGMSGHHRRAAASLQKVEGEPAGGTIGLRGDRCIEPSHCIEQPPLRAFERPPFLAVARHMHVGEVAVQPAGRAARVRRVLRDQPVAADRLGVHAAPPVLVRPRGGHHDALLADREGGQHQRARDEAERHAAALAARVLELQELAAGLANGEFHRRGRGAEGVRRAALAAGRRRTTR